MDPVLVIGIPSEPPITRLVEALSREKIPHLVLNQRHVQGIDVGVVIEEGEASGVLIYDGFAVALESFGGIYSRIVDFELLPEVALVPDAAEPQLHRHAARVHDVLSRWCDITSSRVVNRSATMSSNASKTYQAQIIKRFFEIPATFVTDSPDAAAAFIAEHHDVVYKSLSGTRSIVRRIAESDLARLDDVRHCPVQLQEWVNGTDVRVHTLASGVAFATGVRSDADDYRYGHRDGVDVTLRPYDLDDETAQLCLELAVELGLDFAGIDLRVAPGGGVYCFEVNPSPAYSYYEEETGQAISHALAHYLAGVS